MALECFLNPNHGTPGVVVLTAAGFRRARAAITAWPGYEPTPLHVLPDVARSCGVASVHYKDESPRFGLGSVKALGGAYAVGNLVCAELSRRGAGPVTPAMLEEGGHAASGAVTVCCATDGNHGRSVAWGARRYGARCVIFVHEGVSPARAEAIAAFGAEIRRVAGTYDDSVRVAADTAARNGWCVVSDTAYPGYTEIPREIMQGYRLMAAEALEALAEPPTHVFVQAGVGGIAAAVSVQLRAHRVDATLIVVEPERAACLLLSARAGTPTEVPGTLDTIMAGLACGVPSLVAWQELERSAAAFLAIPDPQAIDAMRRLAGLGIVSGESGAAGLAALVLAAGDAPTRTALGLGADSRVLLFGTEGATDPELYARLVGS